ncbi:hypothetical protein IMCC13023_03130 [Candidatus Aquiluna sp. IMCC13023]|nr:hypothetical protein IMCC13023_03130 [Candidatus Aquiluna sp. IMCC13023]
MLRLGALVFAISSLVLFLAPRVFTDLLGMPGSLNLDWSMQLSGVTILTLGGLMFVIAQAGSTNGVLWAARVMMVGAFGLGVMTLLIPTGVTWFVILYALIGFGFSSAYLVFLARRNPQIG